MELKIFKISKTNKHLCFFFSLIKLYIKKGECKFYMLEYSTSENICRIKYYDWELIFWHVSNPIMYQKKKRKRKNHQHPMTLDHLIDATVKLKGRL